MKIGFKKTDPGVIIPQYKTDGASGADIHANHDVLIKSGETVLIRTGLIAEIPPGVELQVRPRSGISAKTKLRVANSPGSVDSDFKGEICVIMENTTNPRILVHRNHLNEIVDVTLDHDTDYILIKKGDRIAQAVFSSVVRADLFEIQEVSDTARGTGGFGSTGV